MGTAVSVIETALWDLAGKAPACRSTACGDVEHHAAQMYLHDDLRLLGVAGGDRFGQERVILDKAIEGASRQAVSNHRRRPG